MHSIQGLETQIASETHKDPVSEVTDGCESAKNVLIGCFRLLARRPLISKISALQFAFFLIKMLITVTTPVTLPVFVVLITISSAFVVSLRSVSTTLIGRGLRDK
jgi:hypothetical protein